MPYVLERENGAQLRTIVQIEGLGDFVSTFYDNPHTDAGILILPGFTEHRSSFDAYGKFLQHGYKVWAFDINGQGESAGSFDLRQMYQTTPLLARGVRQRYGIRRLGVIGNSVGGMAAGLCAEHFDALCLTAAPAGMTDYVSERLLTAIERIPDPLIRLGSVVFDLVESARNADYREKTHAQFKQHNGYAPCAQFGAARIPNLRKFIAALRDAPRLDEYAHLIGKPSLLLYGGEDHLLGIRKDVLPPRLQRMCDSIPAKKNLYMITGADHSLNRKTRMDSSFNQDYEFAYVKEHISYHFADYL